jgi:hypothetical protein
MIVMSNKLDNGDIKNIYTINLKLDILSYLGYFVEDHNDQKTKFEIDGINFEHWRFSPMKCHQGFGWLVSADIEANNFKDANKKFTTKLNNLIPKICFISQCYTENLNQPFLIHKKGSDCAFVEYSRECKSVGLYFDNNALEALEILAHHNYNIPQEFFYYWNDMINAIGYSSKLLLIFAAIDSLEKNQSKRKEKRIELLGKLADKMFIEQHEGKENKGIRNQLSHGEYLSANSEENYLEQVYWKVIEYFNKKILKKDLLNTDVKSPQRNKFNNRKVFSRFIEIDENFDFKKLIDDCDKNGVGPIFDRIVDKNAEFESNY